MKFIILFLSQIGANICRLETRELSRAEFVDQFVCSQPLIRDYIESKVCRYGRCGFQCNSRSVKPIFESHHRLIDSKKTGMKIQVPNKCRAVDFSLDRHKRREICHNFLTPGNGQICKKNDDFCQNLPFNPFSDLGVKGRKLQRSCCEQRLAARNSLSCNTGYSSQKTKFRFHVKVGRRVKRVELQLSLAESCCAQLN